MSDPRSLSLVLFHALSGKLRRYDELTPSQARALLLESLELLPDFDVHKTTVPHVVRVTTREGKSFDFNIQDFADSLVMLHRDYNRLVERMEDQA
ncbi:MAG TPA: hypothetical protein PKE49_07550 [Leptospiraceae bacterium]|nr:hypothetical protein [Leptospirales bacterium]HMU82115.1 hypothetical protein [Leptospiraceae bacterium]HMW61020.1 hypothetical protein [Leptospiraceae bacterium]HMX56363.1 hypothetical protein [Leptospiraceae bacterium]HMY45102.1 hypothetical protein [Leptospiraceae bacterium]